MARGISVIVYLLLRVQYLFNFRDYGHISYTHILFGASFGTFHLLSQAEVETKSHLMSYSAPHLLVVSCLGVEPP